MSFELNQLAGIFETVKVAQVPSSTLFLPFFDTFYIDLKIFYIPFAIFVDLMFFIIVDGSVFAFLCYAEFIHG